MLISSSTKLFAVIGDPISHSLSPAMHNSAFAAVAEDAIYLPFLVKQENLARAVEGMRAIGVKGWNVTIPHKVEIVQYLDGIDANAFAVSAVNTVVNRNGKLIGFNTDTIGFQKAVEKLVGSVTGMNVVILGSGGASKAVVSVLGSENEIIILNRTLSKAMELAEAFPQARVVAKDFNACNLETALSNADLLVNATSVGLSADESLVPKKFLRWDLSVFDLVYKKDGSNTKLVSDALELGCNAIGGNEMLLQQGVAAFELFIEKQAPVDVMRQAFGV